MPVGWYVIQPPSVGAMTPSAKAARASWTGQQPEMGPVQTIMKAIGNANFVGAHPYTGPLAATAKKAVASFNGVQITVGGLSARTQRLEFDAGQATYTAQINSDTKPLLASLAGQTPYAGTISSSVQKVIANLAASKVYTGALDSRLKAAVASLSGQHLQSGAMSPATAKMAAAVAASVPLSVLPSSTGAGGLDDDYDTNKNITYEHTVIAGANQRLYLFCASGHSVWVNPSAFNISATIGGSPVANNWTLVESRLDYGNDSGWRLGHVALYEYISPPAGVWQISVNQTVSNQGIHRMVANSRVYDNVVSTEAWTTQVATSSSAALNLSVTPNGGDRVLFGGGFSALPAFTSPVVAPWYDGGSSRNGDLDYWDCRDVAGEGVLMNFTTSNAMKLGAFILVLKKS